MAQLSDDCFAFGGTLLGVDAALALVAERVHPVVGAADRRPLLAASDGEVARILEVGVDELTAPAAVTSAVQERDGQRVEIPLFRVGGYDIWGAAVKDKLVELMK